MKILTIACWSHEIKYHLFDWDEQALLAFGNIERVGLDSSFIHHSVTGRKSFSAEMESDNLQDAIALIIDILADSNLGVITGAREISCRGCGNYLLRSFNGPAGL